jgi:hypothetical protein
MATIKQTLFETKKRRKELPQWIQDRIKAMENEEDRERKEDKAK